MKLPAICLILGFTVMLCSRGQAQTQPQEIYNKQFNWKITIPEGFEAIDSAAQAKMQQRGAAAIENTIGEQIDNRTKPIFVLRSDQFHYFESNYQSFDPAEDGDFLESCKGVCDIMYNTFEAQMPGVKLDSAFSTEVMGGLVFQKFKVTITIPGKLVLNAYMYNRLFDKQELTISIIAVDKKKEQLLLDAFRSSKFGKQ